LVGVLNRCAGALILIIFSCLGRALLMSVIFYFCSSFVMSSKNKSLPSSSLRLMQRRNYCKHAEMWNSKSRISFVPNSELTPLPSNIFQLASSVSKQNSTLFYWPAKLIILLKIASVRNVVFTSSITSGLISETKSESKF
jgi:hypothetical protein